MKNEKETKQLIEEIAEIYGFQKEKIRNPVQSEDHHVQFSVNGIKYSGNMASGGEISFLEVKGYITDKDCIYNRYIRHEKIVLLKKNEEDEWEDTGMRFNTPQEVEEWIRCQKWSICVSRKADIEKTKRKEAGV